MIRQQRSQDGGRPQEAGSAGTQDGSSEPSRNAPTLHPGSGHRFRTRAGRCTLLAALVTAAFLCSCGTTAFDGAGAPVALELQPVASGLATPLYLTAPPGDPHRLFILEKDGRVRILKDGVLLDTPFLDLSGLVATGAEQGLLGLAFEPFYHLNRRFYVTYTDVGGAITLARYHTSIDPDRADPATAEPLLTIKKSDPLRNGGMIAFNRDGYLFMGVGDGGVRSLDGGNTGQDRSDLFGSILRLEVRGTGYSIPAGNPFRFPNRGELWNYGLRNPWRFSFDRVSGDLYIADVGASNREEINLAEAQQNLARGSNYGWRRFEGSQCTRIDGCDRGGITPPLLEYSHDAGCCVIGGYVYRGAAIPNLRGTYFYGDYCGGWIRSFRYSGREATGQTEWASLLTGDHITSFGEDASGEIYVMTTSGDVFRIVEAR